MTTQPPPIPCPACTRDIRGLSIGDPCPQCGFCMVPPPARRPRGGKPRPRFLPSEMIGVEVHPAIRRLRNAPDIPMLVVGTMLPPVGVLFSVYLFVVAYDAAWVLKRTKVPPMHPDHGRVRSAVACGLGVYVVPLLLLLWMRV